MLGSRNGLQLMSAFTYIQHSPLRKCIIVAPEMSAAVPFTVEYRPGFTPLFNILTPRWEAYTCLDQSISRKAFSKTGSCFTLLLKKKEHALSSKDTPNVTKSGLERPNMGMIEDTICLEAIDLQGLQWVPNKQIQN